MRLNEKQQAEFARWLRQCGAETLEPVGEYEIFRVIAKGHTLSAHQRANGFQNWPIPLQALYGTFRLGKEMPQLGGLPPVKYSGNKKARIKQLAARDGWRCFYCGGALQPIDQFEMEGLLPATVEELCPRQVGGPKHISNQTLACLECNNRAANQPVVLKVKLRERLRARRANGGADMGTTPPPLEINMPANHEENADTGNVSEIADSSSGESQGVPA